MQTLSLFSPAKINLFLHITGQRDDGYHNLQSVFRALNFGDELEFTLLSASDDVPLVTLIGADGLTETAADNLIVKAAALLADNYPKAAKPVTITLNKRIPTGAGLGGGSSNCAATLVALNVLWELDLPLDELLLLAAALGADVPFFVFAQCQHPDAIATGIGEQLTEITLPDCDYLLLLPEVHLATAELFCDLNLRKDAPIIDDLPAQVSDFAEQFNPPFHNAFEPIATAYAPDVAAALNYLRTLEPAAGGVARMTGTGSAVYLPIVASV